MKNIYLDPILKVCICPFVLILHHRGLNHIHSEIKRIKTKQTKKTRKIPSFLLLIIFILFHAYFKIFSLFDLLKMKNISVNICRLLVTYVGKNIYTNTYHITKTVLQGDRTKTDREWPDPLGWQEPLGWPEPQLEWPEELNLNVDSQKCRDCHFKTLKYFI